MNIYAHCDGELGNIGGRASLTGMFAVSTYAREVNIDHLAVPARDRQRPHITLFLTREQTAVLVEQLTAALEETAEAGSEEATAPARER